MLQPATTALLQAATSTFESLAMLFPEPRNTDGSELIPLAATFAVSFSGAGSGRVVVGVTAGVLPALAGNMLGAPAADGRLQHDALGELTNVITGNVLPLVHGAAAVFHLGAPAADIDAPFVARPGETQLALTRVQMDEGEAILAMFSTTDTTACASSHPTVAIRA